MRNYMFCGPCAPTSPQFNLPERFNKAAKFFTGILMCLLSRSRKLLAKINKSSRSTTRLKLVFTLLGKVAMGASWDDSMNWGAFLFEKTPCSLARSSGSHWRPYELVSMEIAIGKEKKQQQGGKEGREWSGYLAPGLGVLTIPFFCVRHCLLSYLSWRQQSQGVLLDKMMRKKGGRINWCQSSHSTYTEYSSCFSPYPLSTISPTACSRSETCIDSIKHPCFGLGSTNRWQL